MTFDEFMDYLDENPSILQEFSEWMTETSKQNEVFNKEAKKRQRQGRSNVHQALYPSMY